MRRNEKWFESAVRLHRWHRYGRDICLQISYYGVLNIEQHIATHDRKTLGGQFCARQRANYMATYILIYK